MEAEGLMIDHEERDSPSRPVWAVKRLATRTNDEQHSA